MIQTGVASPMTTSGTFTLVSDLGGGSVAYTGAQVYNSNSSWGPQNAFNNTTADDGWCSSAFGNFYGQWVFPFPVVVTTLFMMPRSTNDSFPTSGVTVLRDGISIGTFNEIPSISGHGPPWSGRGYKIQPNSTPGTTWIIEYPSFDYPHVGEIEFWGYRAS
jgi:hypothetical protein